MSDMSGGSDPLKEVVENMKREAYAAGWKAAIDAVAEAVLAIPTPEGADIAPGTPFVGPPKPPNPNSNSAASLPTVGTTPYYVYQAVQRKQGMTGAEVIAAVRADGHDAAEPQIRTALSRLERRQLLANRHRKWFLK
ncbi:MAG: hypothetical protein WDO17_01110 [Alphaproteobacteria bacterium]